MLQQRVTGRITVALLMMFAAGPGDCFINLMERSGTCRCFHGIAYNVHQLDVPRRSYGINTSGTSKCPSALQKLQDHYIVRLLCLLFTTNYLVCSATCFMCFLVNVSYNFIRSFQPASFFGYVRANTRDIIEIHFT